MTSFDPGVDDTVRIQPPPRRMRGGLRYIIALATLLVVSAGVWLLWPVPSAPPSISVSPCTCATGGSGDTGGPARVPDRDRHGTADPRTRPCRAHDFPLRGQPADPGARFRIPARAGKNAEPGGCPGGEARYAARPCADRCRAGQGDTLAGRHDRDLLLWPRLRCRDARSLLRHGRSGSDRTVSRGGDVAGAAAPGGMARPWRQRRIDLASGRRRRPQGYPRDAGRDTAA